MISNYLKIAVRNFLRNKNYTLINILGLSIGITACLIIFLLITYELKFDKFHTKYDNIYRIVQFSETPAGIERGATTPYPLAKAFRNDFAEIPIVTQLHFQEEVLAKVGEDKQKIENVIFADSLFFRVFDFKVLSGNPSKELAEPGKVFLTRSLAEKMIRGNDQVVIRVDNRVDLQVVGIVDDPPASSHINFSMIVSMPTLTGDFIGGLPLDQWSLTSAGFVYVVLPDNISSKDVNDRLKPFATKYLSKDDAEGTTYGLQPLREIHFDDEFSNPGTARHAAYTDLVVMSILGLFILAIACINFINLATAMAIKKSKEIGIRKTLGAKRGQLTLYFLLETFLLTLFSVLISLGITERLLFWLNQFLNKQLDLAIFTDPWLLMFLVVLILLTTLFSGFYPAVVLSGFNPVAVLKNKMAAHGSSGAAVRRSLVLFQFIIAQALIIGTLIVADQMQYFENKPLGFDKEAVINVPLPEKKDQLMQSLRARLEGRSQIRQISFSLGAPTSDNNFSTTYFLTERGSAERSPINVKPVDRHYLETYGMRLKAGRWFTAGDEAAIAAGSGLGESGGRYVYVINASAAKHLGFSEAGEIIGKHITTGVNGIDAEVVGVVEDFHISSLHDEISPVVLMNFPYFYYDAGIKIETTNLPETIRFIEKQWEEVYPDYNFEYQFLDEMLATLYREDQRTFTMFKIFAGISIFIGCLGLYGLISFIANQKLKEVGIRKVMGASVFNILTLFSKEFVRIILIAFVIAAPLSWYLMNQWLQGFAYRTNIHWSVFAIGVLATLLIALLTVGYRSLRAASTNPAETLRME